MTNFVIEQTFLGFYPSSSANAFN